MYPGQSGPALEPPQVLDHRDVEARLLGLELELLLAQQAQQQPLDAGDRSARQAAGRVDAGRDPRRCAPSARGRPGPARRSCPPERPLRGPDRPRRASSARSRARSIASSGVSAVPPRAARRPPPLAAEVDHALGLEASPITEKPRQAVQRARGRRVVLAHAHHQVVVAAQQAEAAGSRRSTSVSPSIAPSVVSVRNSRRPSASRTSMATTARSARAGHRQRHPQRSRPGRKAARAPVLAVAQLEVDHVHARARGARAWRRRASAPSSRW